MSFFLGGQGCVGSWIGLSLPVLCWASVERAALECSEVSGRSCRSFLASKALGCRRGPEPWYFEEVCPRPATWSSLRARARPVLVRKETWGSKWWLKSLLSTLRRQRRGNLWRPVSFSYRVPGQPDLHRETFGLEEKGEEGEDVGITSSRSILIGSQPLLSPPLSRGGREKLLLGHEGSGPV